MSQAGRSLNSRAKHSDQSSGQSGCAADADLLSEDRAHGELESVPAARNAQAGPLPDARR